MRSLQNGGGEALAEQKEREKSLRDELRVHRERSSYLQVVSATYGLTFMLKPLALTRCRVLQSELAALHRDFSDQAEAHDSQMKILHHSMAAQRAETEALRQELMKRPTPEELELLRQQARHNCCQRDLQMLPNTSVQVRALHAVGFSHLDGEVETGDELPTGRLQACDLLCGPWVNNSKCLAPISTQVWEFVQYNWILLCRWRACCWIKIDISSISLRYTCLYSACSVWMLESPLLMK